MRSVKWSAVVVAGLAAATAFPAVAQDTGPPGADADTEPGSAFFQSRIPEEFKSLFVCHQAGAKIVELADVTSFAPRKIEDVMTFSVITKDGTNHLIYLGDGTTCGLSVTPPG